MHYITITRNFGHREGSVWGGWVLRGVKLYWCGGVALEFDIVAPFINYNTLHLYLITEIHVLCVGEVALCCVMVWGCVCCVVLWCGVRTIGKDVVVGVLDKKRKYNLKYFRRFIGALFRWQRRKEGRQSSLSFTIQHFFFPPPPPTNLT